MVLPALSFLVYECGNALELNISMGSRWPGTAGHLSAVSQQVSVLQLTTRSAAGRAEVMLPELSWTHLVYRLFNYIITCLLDRAGWQTVLKSK